MATDPGKVARNKLIELERRRQLAVVTQFKRIEIRLAAEISDLLERIDKERRIDGNASPGLLFEKTRLSRILNNLTDDIRAIDGRLAAIAAGSQTDAIEVARQQSESIPQISSDLGFFDSAATRELIGIAGDGQPLATLFADLAIPARTAVFDALFYGVAAGIPNGTIARQIRDAIGGTTARAMTITRTETNRAYREATRKFYEQAPGVIGWRWLAVLDLRTCPICWALHGRIFKTKTKFGTHPNCRCTMVAVFAGDAKVQTGPEIFDGLTDAQKKTILGPRRLELYQQGANLSDFVETNRSAFGIGRNIKPLIRTAFKPKPRPGPVVVAPTPPPALMDLTTPAKTLPAAKVLEIRPGDPVPIFATTADAAEYMQKRFAGKRFDYGGMDLSLAQSNAAEMARLLDLYPGAAGRLAYVGTYRDRAKLLPGDPGRIRGSFWAQEYRLGTKTVIGYGKAFADGDKLRAAKKRSFAVGWHVTDAEQSTTTHEFGHAVEDWLDFQSTRNLFGFAFADGRNELSTVKNRIIRELKPKAAELSTYGTNGRGWRQRAEQFAEGFSMIHNRPESDWPPFVRALNRLIDYVNGLGEYDASAPVQEFRDLPEAEKAKLRAEFEQFIKDLGLKVK